MSAFCFSLISDMHVDFPQPKTPYADFEEWVIDAGDSSNGLVGTKFLNKIMRKGHKVFAVDGNHSHYANLSQNRTMLETEEQFYKLLDQPQMVEVSDDLVIWGRNGWYHVRDEETWQSYMNDSFYGNLTAARVNSEAICSADALDEFLRYDLKGRKAIVVTHTSPCLETLNPDYDGHFSNEWYWNPNMGRVMARHADKIAVWCHGHSHRAADKIVNGVRVVCNPRGYPGENPGWKPLTIEISV